MRKTKIEWADSTWNPVTGCYHQCEYCCARTMVRKFSGVKIGDGRGNLIVLDEPYVSADGKTRPYPYEFLPTFHRYRLGDYEKKKGRTIFVCSMADLFGAWVPDEWIAEVFEACAKAPQHRYMFLTKNPRRYTECGVPMDGNKWYGTSITTAKEMERIHWLNACGGAFVSFEPLREDVKPEEWINFKYLNWVIIGAETGNQTGKATPDPKWIGKIINAAEYHGIPVFMKNSLIPIVGEQNMIRNFPWSGGKANEA